MLIAIVFGKHISYFIPDMTFLVSISDIHNKWEEEVLALYRELEYQVNPELARRFMKILLEYNIEQQDPDWGIPDVES